jgi:heat shock protein HslJ
MAERSANVWFWILAAALIVAAPPAWAQQFPFEREMVLDEKPMAGSKRVPILEILADGRAMIDLWCKSGEGRAEIKGEAITITLGAMREDGCTPERLQRDEDLARALAQVMQWRLEDDEVVVLEGPTELRYRLSTH